MSKFEQLLTRYITARQHVESCVKKLQYVLDHLRTDWEWPQQEHKTTKHIYHNLRYESRARTPGHADIFGHAAFTTDTAGGVHTVLSATVSEEHMQSPLSVRLSIAVAGPGKWMVEVDGTHVAICEDDAASMRELSEHIFGRFMFQLESRHWAPQPVRPTPAEP